MADQAVAAVNLGEQGPSSISEAVVHPDLTTIVQQHIVHGCVAARCGSSHTHNLTLAQHSLQSLSG